MWLMHGSSPPFSGTNLLMDVLVLARDHPMDSNDGQSTKRQLPAPQQRPSRIPPTPPCSPLLLSPSPPLLQPPAPLDSVLSAAAKEPASGLPRMGSRCPPRGLHLQAPPPLPGVWRGLETSAGSREANGERTGTAREQCLVQRQRQTVVVAAFVGELLFVAVQASSSCPVMEPASLPCLLRLFASLDFSEAQG